VEIEWIGRGRRALDTLVRNRANPENEIGQEPRAQQAINGIGF